jgi:hypothetical protein
MAGVQKANSMWRLFWHNRFRPMPDHASTLALARYRLIANRKLQAIPHRTYGRHSRSHANTVFRRDPGHRNH